MSAGVTIFCIAKLLMLVAYLGVLLPQVLRRAVGDFDIGVVLHRGMMVLISSCLHSTESLSQLSPSEACAT
jgi:hypothetical protein